MLKSGCQKLTLSELNAYLINASHSVLVSELLSPDKSALSSLNSPLILDDAEHTGLVLGSSPGATGLWSFGNVDED